jgi:hypothetical protein
MTLPLTMMAFGIVGISHAEDYPLLVSSPDFDHLFISALAENQGQDWIVNQACNYSSAASSFYWPGARYGVPFDRPLPAKHCASVSYRVEKPEEVIDTYSYANLTNLGDVGTFNYVDCSTGINWPFPFCDNGALSNFGRLLTLQLFGYRFEGEFSTVAEAQIGTPATDGEQVISIILSPGISALVFAPGGEREIEESLFLMADQELEILTLDEALQGIQISEASPDVVTGESQVFVLRGDPNSERRFEIFLEQAEILEGLSSIFIQAQNGPVIYAQAELWQQTF